MSHDESLGDDLDNLSLNRVDMAGYKVLKHYGEQLPAELLHEVAGNQELLERVNNMDTPDVALKMGLPRPARPYPRGWRDPDGIVPEGDGAIEMDPVALYNIGQREQLDANQVKNNAGGYVYAVDNEARLLRFLVFGSDTGSYYTSKRELTNENLKVVDKLIEEKKGPLVVRILKQMKNRVPKKDTILFVLAKCAGQNDDCMTKRDAYAALGDICRIPTHLFKFLEYYRNSHRIPKKHPKVKPSDNNEEEAEIPKKHPKVKPSDNNEEEAEMDTTEASTSVPTTDDGKNKILPGRGWGRAHRMGVTKWYLQYAKKPRNLARHVTKYSNRERWTHQDVLRMAHIRKKFLDDKPGIRAVFKFVCKGYDEMKKEYGDAEEEEVKDVLNYLDAVQRLSKIKHAEVSEVEEACKIIEEYGLEREHVEKATTELLKTKAVWKTLLCAGNGMPIDALRRNLSSMSKCELIAGKDTDVECVEQVLSKLKNPAILEKIHPFNWLITLRQYPLGRGFKGKSTWDVNPKISEALEEAYYKSFGSVKPTNKRICIAIDISSSMEGVTILNTNITAREGAAAMAMMTVRTEKQKKYSIVGFHSNMINLNITDEMTLSQVADETRRHGFGTTNCALPMRWALQTSKLFDAFVIYTDSETYVGAIHPSKALRDYRIASNIPNAKLIVVALSGNGFTIADPNDPNMLDVVGFDAATPQLISDFITEDLFTKKKKVPTATLR